MAHPMLVCPRGWAPAKHKRHLSPVHIPGSSWVTAPRRDPGSVQPSQPSLEMIRAISTGQDREDELLSEREEKYLRSCHWENPEIKLSHLEGVSTSHRPPSAQVGELGREDSTPHSPSEAWRFCCTFLGQGAPIYSTSL